MSADDADLLAEAVKQLQQQQDLVDGFQQGVHEIAATATSRGRALSVTVSGRGEVTRITFHGTRFRTMTGPELAELLVDTIAAARRDSDEQLAALYAPMLPDGIDLAGGVTGEIDLSEMLHNALAEVGLADLLRGDGHMPPGTGREARS